MKLSAYGLALPSTVTCGVQGYKDNLHHLTSAHQQGKLQNSLSWPSITQVSLTNSSWEGMLLWKCQERIHHFHLLFQPLLPTSVPCSALLHTSVSPALSPAPLPSSDRRHFHPTEILFHCTRGAPLNALLTSGGWRLSHHKSLSRLSDNFSISSVLVSLHSFPKCLMEKKKKRQCGKYSTHR